MNKAKVLVLGGLRDEALTDKIFVKLISVQ